MKRLVAIMWLALVPAAALAIGPEVRRVTPPNRPYIIEIGQPKAIGSRALDQERKRDSDLRYYMEYYGWPDYAEVQEIEPDIPWEDYEVHIYYLDRNLEIAFGRAIVSPGVQDLGVLKYQGYMEPETRDRIVALVTPARSPEVQPVEFRRPEPEAPMEAKPVAAAAPVSDSIEAIVLRMEAAAERASVAADQAAAASEAATRSADRAANIMEKMSR